MKLTRYFAIAYFFMLMFVNMRTSFCACVDMPTTTGAADAPAFATITPEDLQELCQFPQLKDVEYQIAGEDQTKDKYLTSCCNFNNGCMKKVIQVIEQCKKSENEFNFIHLATQPVLQKFIAHAAKVDQFFVRLYISRALAWHIRSTEDPLQKALKIKCCRAFWDDNQLYILLSFLRLEDSFLSVLYLMQQYLTNVAFYASKSADLVYSVNPLLMEVCRKIKEEHLPYTTLYLRHYDRPLFKQFLNKTSATEWAALPKDFDQTKKDKLLKEIKTELVQSSDPCLRKIAFTMYYRMYEWLTRDKSLCFCNCLGHIHDGMAKSDNWFLPDVNRVVAKQIMQLINATSSADDSLEMNCEEFTKNYTSTLLEIFLDYEGLSMLSSMPKILRLIEDIVKVTIIDSHRTSECSVDGIIAEMRIERSYQQQLLDLLARVNNLFDEYVTTYVPFECAFDEEFNRDEGKIIHPLFTMQVYKISKNRIYGSMTRCINSELGCKNVDQPTVDYLMRTYFPDEQTTRKDAHQSQTKSKKGEKEQNSQPRRQKPICESDGNVMTQQLMAPDHNTQIKPSIILRYHKRILRWFNLQLIDRCQPESIIYHTLPPAIDIYLEKEGYSDDWHGNVRFSLPAKITREDGSSACVICSCTITKDGQIYHRGFDFSTRDVIKQRFGIDIPEDSFTQTDEYKEDPFVVVFRKQLQNRSLLLDDNEKYVMLYDPINKLYVQLFHKVKM